MANDVSVTTSPVVETASGKIRGAASNGILAFKGIRYGASTGGAARFRPPQPAAAWSGARDALAYHGKAPQSPAQVKRRSEMDGILGPLDTTPETEDCLTLNVWTPGAAGKRPVMVWLHGGAFAYGSGNRAVTDGAALARRGDVVVVSVNHRLNICGYLHLEDIGGARYAGSGNAGSLDMVLALQWVRDNIAAFGGDPGCVTIFGESGGGGKVSALLAMPAAKGLFHRAVIQSGAAVRFTTRERANALAESVVKQLGGLDKLADVPLGALLSAIVPASRDAGKRAWPLLDRYDFGPVVDGAVVTQHPAEPSTPPLGDDIPLMIGGTAQEAALFLDDDAVWHRTLSEAALRERVAAVAGPDTDAVLALYKARLPGASAADRLIAALTGSNFSVRTWLFADRRAARGGAPVYHYSLEWPSPFGGGRMGAHHAMDLPFVFDTTDVPLSTKGADGAPELAAAMSATWAAFARAGKPDNPAIPAWPAYTAETRATMLFDTRCRVVDDPLRDPRELWSRVATRG
ncbi:MAG: carboxylesterase/lipase family protein [Alphaproteobacteria bacterium]|nr:carboxylesterase/lipase family protein [Alphaproteobacteria bacterium]